MDFKAVILFLCLYFIRPQDWVPGLAGLNIVTPVMALALLAMLSRRRGFDPRELLRTPIDWMMLAYYAYVVLSSPDKVGTLKEAFPLFAFYLTTRQAISDEGRLSTFLKVWTGLIVIIAGMAVGSLFGLDITRSAGMTAEMDGRLVLNTWMLNNPNDLGHCVIAGIPLIYFQFIWRKPLAYRFLGLLFIVLVAFCVFETESKGAFVAGFATIVASMMFGRPKIFQVVLLAVALTVGTTALYQLPRMGALNDARSDEGILGRLLAWEMARTASRTLTYGEGWKKFEAWIDWEGEDQLKATHSGYVKIGADLGYPGLFIFVGILYAALRVLVQTRAHDDEEEMARRMLFAIVVSYAVSNWMSDRAYHTELFLMAGAVSAFHFLLRRRPGEEEEEEEEAEVPLEGVQHVATTCGFLLPSPAPMAVGWSRSGGNPSTGAVRGGDDSVPAGLAIEGRDDEGDSTLRGEGHPWKRIGLVDLALMGLLLHLTLRAWDYIMRNL